MTDFVVEGVGRRLVPYAEGLELQARLHDQVVAGQAPDTVILLEHEAVYTAGKRTEDSERPVDGTPVVEVDRGGKITWHGPGQLVGYPILRLPDPIDVVAYVRSLESLLLDVVIELGVVAHRVEGRSGIWTTVDGTTSKLGAIGIRVASGVTTHGFALNCSNSLEPYERIVACGIRDAGVTTISEILGRRVDPVDVVDSVMAKFESPGDRMRDLVRVGHEVVAAGAR
ncbi:lipoyl(octanoyl) transferase LipB [Herbiconiux ginsengi]|uniref:Octanoyltransferase n=1 Tax=Herbiconiux ginsengi TaxID=381665 RepID=A0A1H3N1A7_9MICO|nr:lipoyl(octanoyl) transferase LipB [Herbiconiux ginsengi]SDY82707.1 lipoyl(octanoyl) transferase [Herbiconiux ginsengi]